MITTRSAAVALGMLAPCKHCGEAVGSGDITRHILELGDVGQSDRIHTYQAHVSCDENATPEQLNAIRDAILGE